MGQLPIVDSELAAAADAEGEDDGTNEPTVVTRTRITADGTYATESVYTSDGRPVVPARKICVSYLRTKDHQSSKSDHRCVRSLLKATSLSALLWPQH